MVRWGVECESMGRESWNGRNERWKEEARRDERPLAFAQGPRGFAGRGGVADRGWEVL